MFTYCLTTNKLNIPESHLKYEMALKSLLAMYKWYHVQNFATSWKYFGLTTTTCFMVRKVDGKMQKNPFSYNSGHDMTKPNKACIILLCERRCLTHINWTDAVEKLWERMVINFMKTPADIKACVVGNSLPLYQWSLLTSADSINDLCLFGE